MPPSRSPACELLRVTGADPLEDLVPDPYGQSAGRWADGTSQIEEDVSDGEAATLVATSVASEGPSTADRLAQVDRELDWLGKREEEVRGEMEALRKQRRSATPSSSRSEGSSTLTRSPHRTREEHMGGRESGAPSPSGLHGGGHLGGHVRRVPSGRGQVGMQHWPTHRGGAGAGGGRGRGGGGGGGGEVPLVYPPPGRAPVAQTAPPLPISPATCAVPAAGCLKLSPMAPERGTPERRTPALEVGMGVVHLPSKAIGVVVHIEGPLASVWFDGAEAVLPADLLLPLEEGSGAPTKGIVAMRAALAVAKMEEASCRREVARLRDVLGMKERDAGLTLLRQCRREKEELEKDVAQLREEYQKKCLPTFVVNVP